MLPDEEKELNESLAKLKSADIKSQQEAIRALQSLSFLDAKEPVTEAIARAGVIPLVIQHLSSSSEYVLADACDLVSNLAENTNNRITLSKLGAIPLLIQALNPNGFYDENPVFLNAIKALQKLALNDANRVQIAKTSGFAVFIRLLEHSYAEVMIETIATISNLALNTTNQIEIAKAGGIPLLVRYLQSSSPPSFRVREIGNATRALRNLAMNTSNQVAIAKAGGIPLLVRLLDYPYDVGGETRENATGALNFLERIPANRVAIQSEKQSFLGTIEQFRIAVTHLTSASPRERKNAALTLHNLARTSDDDRERIAKMEAIPLLVTLLQDSDSSIRSAAIAALCNLAVNHQGNKRRIVKLGAVPILLNLLQDQTIFLPSLVQALGNLQDTSGYFSKAVIEANGIPALTPLLENTNDRTREIAADIFIGLAGYSYCKPEQLKTYASIVQAGAIPSLVRLLSDSNERTRKSADGTLGWLEYDAEIKLTIEAVKKDAAEAKLTQSSFGKKTSTKITSSTNQSAPLETDLFNAAYEKCNAGNYEGAIEGYTKVIQLNGKHVSAFFNRAVAKSALGDFSGSIADYTRCLQCNPTSELAEKARKAIEIQKTKAQQAKSALAPPPPPTAPNASTQIPPNQLSFNPTNPATQLGEGGFGIVYRGQYTPVQGDVAIKALHPFRATPTAAAELKQEAALMARLTSDYIVRFYGFSQWTDDRTLLVMEYCPSGSLFDYLHPEETTRSASANDLSWSMRYYLAQDITRGLDYLHSQRPMIIHRDLKSHNVLLALSPEGRLQAKLSDFGLAKMKNESSSQTRRTQSAAGTVAWMAPELLIEDEDDKVASASTRTDIYALGMVFWELASGEVPFGDKKIAQIIGLLVQTKRPKIPQTAACDTRFSDLIQRCWDQRPHSRPSAQDVVQTLGPLLNLGNRGASAAEEQPRTTPNSFFSRLRSSFSGSSKKAAGTHDSTLFSR